MNKRIKWLPAGLALCLMVTPALAASGTVQKTLDYRDISISVNGTEITPTDVNGNSTEPFVIDGTTYLPLRAIAEALDCDVRWDAAANTVIISTAAALEFAPASESDTVQGFICAVDKAGTVYWKAGLNSYEDVFETFGLTDDSSYLKAFVVPDNDETYKFLYPEKGWKGLVSADSIPGWFTADVQAKVAAAFTEWKDEVYSLFDYKTLRTLSAADTIAAAPAADYQVTEEDIAALKSFVEIEDKLLVYARDSVLYTIEKYCGTAIRTDIWNRFTEELRALTPSAISDDWQKANGVMAKGVTSSNYMCEVIGSYFYFDADQWLYCNLETDSYPYACGRYLFDKGLYPWIDSGTSTWHLSTADGSLLYGAPDSEIGPAQAFSCLIDAEGNVYWRTALDSASDLERAFAQDIKADYICVHVQPALAVEDATFTIPDGKDPSILKTFAYFDPASTWTLSVEGDKPAWFTAALEEKAMAAFNEWKANINSIVDYDGVREIFISQPKEITVTDEDVALLGQWAALWQAFTDNGDNPAAKIKQAIYANVGLNIYSDMERYITNDWRQHHVACTGTAVSAGYLEYTGLTSDDPNYSKVKSTVSDSVLDMQTALTAFYLKNIDWGDGAAANPYECVATLVLHGLIPNTDGTSWYLTNVDTAEVIYSISAAELLG